MKKPLIFGHRGASGYEHENSYAAFDKAIEQGADGIETDAWLLADGKTVVLHHDKAIAVPDQDTPANISKLMPEDIDKIILPNGEKIPYFEEFLKKYQNTKAASGEPLLFSIDTQDLKVGAVMVPIIEQLSLLDRVYLCGGTMLHLKKIRKTNQNVLLVASNMENQIKPENLEADSKIMKLKPFAFNTEAGNYKPEHQKLLHSTGLKSFIWDLHDEKSLCEYLPHNPDAIYSNYPDVAIKCYKKVSE
jgi:glycerophosphoryl diester phosphodiesterase